MKESEFKIIFCPFCGAEDEELTGGSCDDLMFKKERYNMFCNECKTDFIVFVV